MVGADREILRAALQRAAILSNEKYRGIRLSLKPGVLTLQSHNPEQEEAEEELDVTYSGEEMEIGFNVNYLLDALAALDGAAIEIGLTDSNNSCLLTSSALPEAKYVVMPMRL
jgi:DNA polymerase-3 subunit beta